ncbi:MipA/OmpV family protein [Shewanella sp. C32]|uniref:MipA/OmpV family protein n=1 Tax=Shewanella electrica TaxID=515560 RepID=A0ABT2FHP5_9GAMM|nr:MipA/OmpV family protein [Shewanella electrica]MCH1923389.1 MipA/OmpV family protein [Shewanella electrica]MCS4555486.1 MipA/OmpV family protein [Shewanella electrica]
MRCLRTWCLAGLLLPLSVYAEVAGDKHDHVAVDDWGFDLALGYAAIETPLRQRDSFESFVLPQWYYYGERFYIENLQLGYTLLETDTFIIDVVGYLNDDGLLFNTDKQRLNYLDISKYIPNVGFPLQGKMDLRDIKRDLSYMAGVEFTAITPFADLSWRAARDITEGNGGIEYRLAAKQRYTFNRLKLFWEAGAVMKNAELNNYYYGLRSEESGRRRDVLVTDRSLNNYYLQLAATYQLTSDLSWVVSVNQTWINHQLLDSPLLEKDNYLSGFIGFNLHF